MTSLGAVYPHVITMKSSPQAPGGVARAVAADCSDGWIDEARGRQRSAAAE